ncbi:hypothetical protein BP6252_06573 [Coleophoma cylindrospora]|uniref:Zn(2)-C6 fungal-type domain-containing protein n=1 Tax=Coleophoma cylindrospora TaxID=1849047 RepID=A0A3D8RNP4_9HELO|nr:hypothetical protein BP6252_06573 [Coleophoma cylindrospora]
MTDSAPPPPAPPAPPRLPDPVRKRSSNACDACRSRKTKCIYQGPVCKTCLELKISCTQDKPRKRRGPPNKFVAEQARRQSSFDSGDTASPVPVPLSGIHRLAPSYVVEQIIHSWFDLIHSVAPIFHRGIFLTRLASGEADQDGVFAALVVSVCAATISSLRRKSYKDYGTLTPERCWDVAEEIIHQRRKEPFTLEWCQMKYNLGSSQYITEDDQHFRNLCEAAAGVKFLIHYRMASMPLVSQQLLKRLYWLIFAAGCSSDLHGLPYLGLLTPQDNISALTPLELSDSELDPTLGPEPHCQWHGNQKSYIAGLNYLSKLFLLWHQSQQESAPTIAHLQHYMNLVQRALDYLPPELIWRGGLSRPPQSNFGTDVQTANLYVTQLHIRSNLLEQINRLSRSSTAHETGPGTCTVDRHSIVEDLLEILYHMPQETLEANGNSLIPKIRDIGSALFDEVRTGKDGQGMSEKASENLERLLAKLESLDMHSQLQYLEIGPLAGTPLQG